MDLRIFPEMTAMAIVLAAGSAAVALAGMARLRGQVQVMNSRFQEREQHLRLLMESATDFAVCMLDPDGAVARWDKSAERLGQYRSSEIIGRHFSQFYTEQDQRSRLPARALAIARAEGRYDIEHWFVRKHRGGFWASGVIQPMYAPEGTLVGFAMILRDATSRWLEQRALTEAKEDAEAAVVKAEVLSAEVLAANRELQVANDSLQKFTSIVAHDLGAPLRRVETFVQILHQDYAPVLDDEGKDIMDRIEGGVARIRLMLSSLLDYSKCSRLAILGKTASLPRTVEAVLEDLDLATAHAEVRVDLGGVGDIPGDPQLIGHVIQNLIGNAIKFRRPGQDPVIAVEALRTPGGEIQVSVTDNGVGIEPQYADRVFEMFYRLHGEDEFEGTGIGLSVCRKIVSDHGGRIWVDSSFTGGTRILFALPAEAIGLEEAGAQRAA